MADEIMEETVDVAEDVTTEPAEETTETTSTPRPVRAYWFETKADRKLAKHWPSRSTKRAMQSANMDNMNQVITIGDYGHYFDKQKTPDRVYPMLRSAAPERTHFFKTLDRDFASYLGLATHGYTSNRVLGKEVDKQLNDLIYREITHNHESEVAEKDSDRVWADLAELDPVLTPDAYLKMLTAERVVNDPKLLTSFKTAEQLKALGYNVPAGVEPVRYTDEGKPLYDIVSVYRPIGEKTESGERTKAEGAGPAYAIGESGEISLTHPALAEVITAEDVANIAAAFSKQLGIKLEPETSIAAGEYTNLSVSRARNFGRRILNYIYKHTGRRPRAMAAGKIAYSANGTPAEQLYTLTKAIGNYMVQNPIANTEKVIANVSGASNLPDAKMFADYKDVIGNASACLIASQLISMTELEDSRAQILANMFKVEAGQSLARLPNPKENTWAMPLVSTYMSNGVQLLAGDMKMYTPEARTNYLGKLGVKDTGVGLVNSLMYGKRDFEKPVAQIYGALHPDAVITGTKPEIEPKPDDDKPEADDTGDKPDTEEKKFDRKWWEIKRTYDAMLESKPKYLETLRSAAKDLVKEAISEVRCGSAESGSEEAECRASILANLDKYCVPGGMQELEKEITKAEVLVKKYPGKKDYLETLKLSKEVLESTLDIVECGLEFASEEKVRIDLGGVVTEIYGQSKEVTKKMTGSELFDDLSETMVETTKEKVKFRTVIKRTIKAEVTPYIKKIGAIKVKSKKAAAKVEAKEAAKATEAEEAVM